MKNLGSCYLCSHESVVRVKYRYTGKLESETRCKSCYRTLHTDTTKEIINETWKNKTTKRKVLKTIDKPNESPENNQSKSPEGKFIIDGDEYSEDDYLEELSKLGK